MLRAQSALVLFLFCSGAICSRRGKRMQQKLRQKCSRRQGNNYSFLPSAHSPSLIYTSCPKVFLLIIFLKYPEAFNNGIYMYNVALLMLSKAFEILFILQASYNFWTNYFHSNLSQTHTHTTTILLSPDTFFLFPIHFQSLYSLSHEDTRAAQQ